MNTKNTAVLDFVTENCLWKLCLLGTMTVQQYSAAEDTCIQTLPE